MDVQAFNPLFSYEKQSYEKQLQIAQFTLDYELSNKLVQSIIKDEDIRKLKCRLLLLQDQNDALNDQLATEEENADHLKQQLDLTENQIDDLEVVIQELQNNLRIREREYETAKAEISSMVTLTKDSTKLLTEKLTLDRELAILRPEVESLRAQIETNKSILSEKLSLQRQLTTVQVELENAQRSAQRAFAKNGNNHDQTEFDFQIDDLQQKLREARLGRREAELEVEQLKHDLESEKRNIHRSKSKLIRQNDNNAVIELEDQIETIRGELERSKQDVIRLQKESQQSLKDKYKPENDEASSKLRSQIRDLQKDLLEERKEKQKLEKALQKEQNSWEAQKSLLDDKLNQFRIKLRSTKERLKEAEEQLENHTNHPDLESSKPVKSTVSTKSKGPSKKRKAAQIEDTIMGTPSNEPANKRGKKPSQIAKTIPGDKSTFSITPFLNKTSMSIAPETPEASEVPEVVNNNLEITENADIQQASEVNIQQDDSPTMTKKTKVLSSANSRKHNSKSVGRKLSNAPSLPSVQEESSILSAKATTSVPTLPVTASNILPLSNEKDIESSYNKNIKANGDPEKKSKQSKSKPQSQSQSQSQSQPPSQSQPQSQLQPKLKPRKSLMTFSSYTSHSTIKPTDSTEEKRPPKKRKLGMPKTLFDEGEDEVVPAKPIPGRGLFAARALNKSLGAKVLTKGAMTMLTADNGFQFSPLKKDRRAVGMSILE